MMEQLLQVLLTFQQQVQTMDRAADTAAHASADAAASAEIGRQNTGRLPGNELRSRCDRELETHHRSHAT